MQVVEDEHERLLGGDPLEQRADRAVGPVALVDRRRLTGSGERGKDAAELRRQAGGQLVLLTGGEVGVEGVGPDAEGKVALELGAGPGEDEHVAVVRPAPQLGEQMRLADPGLALDRKAGLRRAAQLVEHQVQLLELGRSPNGLCQGWAHDRRPA